MAAAHVAVFRHENNGNSITSTKLTSNGVRIETSNNNLTTTHLVMASTSKKGKNSSVSPAQNGDSPVVPVKANSVEDVTPLMIACQQGSEADVKIILKKKNSGIKQRTRNGRTALHFCAESGTGSCVDLILAASPDTKDVQDSEGYTALHLAVINGNKEAVKILISGGANLNCLDNENHSLVHWSTVCGAVEILELLLSSGAPASTPDIHMAHPIHYAAQMCGSVSSMGRSRSRASEVQSSPYGVSPKRGLQILKRLIQYGCPIDVRDQDGRQPLLWAASAGSGDAILLLVNAGAKVDAEDKDGLTALHCAASRGNHDCLETLISLCGTEVDVIDNNGCTALFYAVTMGHADCTELLLNYGADPNRQDRKARTPAHCGAAKGQLETLKLLAKHGANMWMRNVRGDLPLHDAVLSRRKDLVIWLLTQRPESVNIPNNDGRCPIHLAALNNNVEMVKILIDHNASVNMLMRSGKGATMTPLDAAMHKGHNDVAKFLTLHGGLPTNSLTDAALHRRTNRSVIGGQISPASTVHGGTISNAGSHHQSSPDHRTFVSPETFDNSVSRTDFSKLGNNFPYAINSTPTMDDGVQTDNGRYLRDMEVQVSDSFDEESQNKSSKKSTRRRKRWSDRERRRSDEDSSEEGDRTKSNKPRGSRRSSKVNPANEITSRTQEEAINLVDDGQAGGNSVILDNNGVEQDHEVEHEKPSLISQGSSDGIHEHENDNTLISEKFSELEHAGAQSSETDAREEDLGIPDEQEKQVDQTDGAVGESDQKQEEPATPEPQTNKDSVIIPRPTSHERSQSGRRSVSAKSERKDKISTSASKPRSRSASPHNSSVRSKSKHEEPGEIETLDEIEAGRAINLQEVARKRAESLARDPSRSSRSRSMSLSHHSCTESSANNSPRKKVLGASRKKPKAQLSAEEKEIQLQEALIASSKGLREPKKTTKKVDKRTPIVIRPRSIKGFKTRQSAKSDELSRPIQVDSGISVTTSNSEDLRAQLSPEGKTYVTVKRRVIARRPSSGHKVSQRKTIFSSSPKQLQYRTPRPIRNHKGYDTMMVHQTIFSNGLHDEESTSTRGSITSDDMEVLTPRRKKQGGMLSRPRSNLTFSRNDMVKMSPRPKKSVDIETQISVTQAMQASMRKYNLERIIFHELLELKRLQIRSGRANEQLMVKRIAENYKRAGYSVNFKDFEGPFTFKDFETYLYDQLRLLQGNKKMLPRFAPSDDIEKLSVALKKMDSTKLPYLDDIERCDSVRENIQCTHTTHRCHHASHAYTGVPCAAYIGNRKQPNGLLPRVNPIKAPGPTQKDSPSKRNMMKGNPLNFQSPLHISITPRTFVQSPISLEVQQGNNTQTFTLPTKTLDPSKDYYVSLSIKPSATSPSPTPHHDRVGGSSAPGDVVDDGSISAPPPPIESNGVVDPDIEREKNNRSM